MKGFFDKIFNKNKKESNSRFQKHSNEKNEKQSDELKGILSLIKIKEKEDPQIAAKLAAKEIKHRVLSTLIEPGGRVHVESAFAILGSLAGYECLQYTLISFIENPNSAGKIMTIKDKDDKTYILGDASNKNISFVFSVISQKLKDLNAEVPDINEIIAHSTSVIGSEDYGVPRIPEGHQIGFNLVDTIPLYGSFMNIVLLPFKVKREDWRLAYALAICTLIQESKDILDPSISAKIVFECLIPMSKKMQ